MKIETIDQLKKNKKYYIYRPIFRFNDIEGREIIHDPNWFACHLSEIRYGDCVFFENKNHKTICCIGITKFLKLSDSHLVYSTKKEMVDEWNKKEDIKFDEIEYCRMLDRFLDIT